MRKNKWKSYFLSLLAINIIVLLILIGLLFWPGKLNDFEKKREITKGSSSEFIIHTTKDNLNDLINAYIDELVKDNRYHYRITLDEDVLLEGEIPLFSASVPLSIHMDPYVLEDGNIVLKQQSISIGKLRLPNQQVMKYMEWFFKVPDWVKFYPEYEEIHIQITDMDIKSNFRLHVEQFDLLNNDLSFKIEVPYETLGLNQLKAETQR